MTDLVIRYAVAFGILTAALLIAAEDTARALLGWEHGDAP